MQPSKTRVAVMRRKCSAEPEKNVARAIDFIRDATKQGTQVVCLPELFQSQYFCQSEDHGNFKMAEEVPGGSTIALGESARELGIVIIASFFEKRRAGVSHNSAVIIDSGR